MGVLVTNIIPRKQAANANETQYTATNCTTVIDKFTVTNTSSGNVIFALNLVADGDSVGADNTIIDSKVISPGSTYQCNEAVGQVLLIDGFISTWASAATSLTISASGREIT